MPRGEGGGSTIHRITLTDAAADALRRRIGKPRYTKDDANMTVSALLLSHTVTLPAELLIPAVPWIEQALAQCFNPAARAALETLLAAIRAAQDEQ